jgi:hypothetical protein
MFEKVRNEMGGEGEEHVPLFSGTANEDSS